MNAGAGVGDRFELLSTAAALPASRKFAVELDVLRGLAAVLMIVNHAGYRLLSAEGATEGVVGALVFLGSFAPVLFFFTTGFGVALAVNASGRTPELRSTAIKALLLVVADQLMFRRLGSTWGLNFLGFIGVSSLLVSALARSRRAVALCSMGIAAIVLVRYGIAPRLVQPSAQSSWLVWMTGVRGMNDMPYPPAPWLVYPFAGFVLGRWYAKVDLGRSVPRNRWFLLGLGATVVLAAVAGLLHTRGATFFRWGTVSAAYFVLSLAVVAGTGLLSMWLAMSWRRLAAGLSLRGVASFAVIPLHYAVLEILASGVHLLLAAWVFVPVAGAVTWVCFWASDRFSGTVSAWVAGPHRVLFSRMLYVLLVVAIAVCIAFGAGKPSLSFAAMVIGQLSVAGLLAIRGSRQTSRAHV